MAFSKNLYLTILIIFLIIGFWGLEGSPSFFSFFFSQETLAASFQPSVTITISVCGDGTIDAGETCDDGGLNSAYGYFAAQSRGYCLTDCSGFAPYCGDGAVQSGYGEQCDDSNRTSGDGCSSACKTEGGGGNGGGGGGGGGGAYIPPAITTKVVIQGKAYPLSSITVLQDGKVGATGKADVQANFKIEITNVTAGICTFGVWAEDSDGRRSITFTFTTSISAKTVTTIGGIFIPPTIELNKFNLQKGETLNILGQTAPESEVSIFINSPGEGITEKTEADADGTWFFPFDTAPLEEGLHTSRAKAVSSGGLASSFSKVLSFSLGKEAAEGLCPGADFNKDGRVNLIDFSILLYWWGKENSCCDQNQDGLVGITDFSIMLYYWTG